MAVEKQRLTIEIMQFVGSYLSRKGTLKIQSKVTFRKPTYKEERKHHTLFAKQRKRLR